MDLQTLNKMTVVKLREEAHKFDVKDALGMSKEQLVDLLCDKHGIERKHAVKRGIGRRALKARISALKKERGETLASGDRSKIRKHRRRLHHARRSLRKVIARAARAEAIAEAKRAREAPAEAPPAETAGDQNSTSG